jgi:hypothetical protein
MKVGSLSDCRDQGMYRFVMPASDHRTHLIVAEWYLVAWAMSFAAKPITLLKPPAN